MIESNVLFSFVNPYRRLCSQPFPRRNITAPINVKFPGETTERNLQPPPNPQRTLEEVIRQPAWVAVVICQAFMKALDFFY